MISLAHTTIAWSVTSAQIAAWLLLAFICQPYASLQAKPSWILVEENFDYPDGRLPVSGTSDWRRQMGSPPLHVSGQSLIIGPGTGAEGYITRVFNRPIATRPSAPPVVEAQIKLSLSHVTPNTPLQPDSVGTVLQFVASDGERRRGRLLFRTLPQNRYQLGVCSRTIHQVVWSDRVLQPAVTYSVHLVYEPDSGTTRLWINPEPTGFLGLPLAVASDSDTTPVTRISLQTSPQHGPHLLKLDDLLVQPFGEIN